MRITPKVLRFIDEYLVDMNGTQAAIRAGYSAKTANVQACQMLARPEIQELIQERMNDRAARTEITQDAVLKLLWQRALADPNNLVQYRRTCCRYCYGVDHAYQWTKGEYQRSLKTWQDDKDKRGQAPDITGGFGFDPRKPPVDTRHQIRCVVSSLEKSSLPAPVTVAGLFIRSSASRRHGNMAGSARTIWKRS